MIDNFMTLGNFVIESIIEKNVVFELLEHFLYLVLYSLIIERHTIAQYTQELSQLNTLNVKNVYVVVIQNDVCEDLFFLMLSRRTTLKLNCLVWIYCNFVYDSYWAILRSWMTKHYTNNEICCCNNIVVSNTIPNINGVRFATILFAKLLANIASIASTI